VSLGGTILPGLADHFGGDGGGHDGAGAATLQSDSIVEIEETLIAMLESELDVTFNQVARE